MSAKNIAFDNHLYDWLTTTRSIPISKNIVIVDIDANELKQNGGWPWSRKYHAKLLGQLNSAKAVGFDLIFSEPRIDSDNGDKLFAEAIKRNGHVVLPILPEMLNNKIVETMPLPLFTQVASGIGHIDAQRDSDGIIRSIFLYGGLGSPRWVHFSQAILAIANKQPLNKISAVGLTNSNVWVRDKEVLVPFPKNQYAFNVLPYQEVLNGLHQEQIKNSIVLIGVSAAGLGDNHRVVTSNGIYNMPGVAIDASIINALQNNILTYRIADIWLLLLGLIILIAVDLLTQRLKLRDSSGLIYYIAAAAIVIFVSVISYYLLNYWLPTPLLALLLILLGISRLLIQQKYFRVLALTDGLTGLANRRHFDERFTHLLQQSKRLHSHLGLMIIDIDYFKSYNDYYGHSAGDEVLRRLAGTLKSMQRNSRDIAARIGGEEFAFLMPNTDEKTTQELAEKLRIAVQSLQIEHSGNASKVVTCSIGTVTKIPNKTTLSGELYEAADMALYNSKHSGRNQVSCYDDLSI